MKVIDIEQTRKNYLAFTEGLKTIMLSTVDEAGNPFISYAPHVKHNGKLYIYLSRIANHYRYMEAHPTVDVMFIEDESQSANLFARQRARFVCSAQNVGEEGYEEVFELFAESFGKNVISMLRTLDFSLFELTPTQGRYVAGFGQAFDIDLAADRFEHVARDGHDEKK